jgi:hypothetical protein
VAALHGHQGGQLKKLFSFFMSQKIIKRVASKYQNYYLHVPKQVPGLYPYIYSEHNAVGQTKQHCCKEKLFCTPDYLKFS